MKKLNFIKRMFCNHKFDKGELVDIGRNKLYTCKLCGKIKLLY